MIKQYKIDKDPYGIWKYAAFVKSWSFMGFTWWTRIYFSDHLEWVEAYIKDHAKLPIYIEYP